MIAGRYSYSSGYGGRHAEDVANDFLRTSRLLHALVKTEVPSLILKDLFDPPCSPPTLTHDAGGRGAAVRY